jgi:hypothetical protein
MEKFSRSFALTKQSWSVLRANPQLSLFPIISSVVTLLVLASFALPGYFLFFADMVNSANLNQEPQFGIAQYAFMFCFYLVSYFVVIFFNAALVYCANEIFAGRQASFGDGMKSSLSKIGPIFVYALISATVGMILRAISERAGIVGSLVARFLGMAWTILTYFVPPILVIEGKGPIEAIKDSGSMLRKTWGENLIFNGSLNLVFGLLSIVAMVPIFTGAYFMATGAMALGIALIAGGVLFLVVICLISSTLTGVFQTALYLYARTGQVPAVYDPAWVQNAFTLKPEKEGKRFF